MTAQESSPLPDPDDEIEGVDDEEEEEFEDDEEEEEITEPEDSLDE